jgi:Protein of unknown function (DUF2934)
MPHNQRGIASAFRARDNGIAVDGLGDMSKSKRRPEGELSGPNRSAVEHGREAIHGNNADYGDRVSQRAYELYLARGRADGRDFDDWIAAERELTNGGGDHHE